MFVMLILWGFVLWTQWWLIWMIYLHFVWWYGAMVFLGWLCFLLRGLGIRCLSYCLLMFDLDTFWLVYDWICLPICLNLFHKVILLNGWPFVTFDDTFFDGILDALKSLLNIRLTLMIDHSCLFVMILCQAC